MPLLRDLVFGGESGSAEEREAGMLEDDEFGEWGGE